MDMPSTVIRGTGILLVIIGLFGTVGGLYGLKVVHDGFNSGGADGVKSSILDVSESLETNRQDVDSSLTNTTVHMDAASDFLKKTGEGLNSASQKLESSSAKIKDSAAQVDDASTMNSDAGSDLKDAYEGLDDWADSYSYDGNSLPQKSKFTSGILKIKEAANKLEVMGDELNSASGALDASAGELELASTKMLESSEDLKSAGESLNKSSASLRKFKSPLVSMLSDVSNPLEDITSQIDSVLGPGSSLKTGGYAFVCYIIFMHIILLLIGIALIVIEVNLFYPV